MHPRSIPTSFGDYHLNPTGAPPPQDQPSARQIAHRLIGIHRSEGSDDSAARAGAAACDRLYRNLSRWVGSEGCHALFTSAVTQAGTDHPALELIQLHARSEPYLDGVAEAVRTHGDAATAEALESMLARVIQLLGRLIGDYMTAKLIDQGLTQPEHRDAASEARREES